MIGNVIGEEREKLGKALSVMTVTYCSLISFSMGAMTHAYAKDIAFAYTEDSDTMALLERCLESLAFSLAVLGPALSL